MGLGKLALAKGPRAGGQGVDKSEIGAMPRELYLDLMKRCLLGLIMEDRPVATFRRIGSNFSPKKFDLKFRKIGQDWPSRAHSMIGVARMDNLQFCIEEALAKGVPGDLVETGVWRGGATIFMRAVLKAHNVQNRTVWVADSFRGLPHPNPSKYPADKGLDFTMFNDTLAISLSQVKHYFGLYGLLDDQVRFLEGWFKDTLPTAPIERLAVLRIDGDLYESTMDALTHLYPKLSPGGYVIIDDYVIPACARAVRDYCKKHHIREDIQKIDKSGVFWQREA